MAIRSRIVVCLVCLAAVLFATGNVSADRVAPEKEAPDKADNLGIGGRLKAELKEQGFEVKDGYFQLWTIEDCPDSFEVMGTCEFNNPTAPYLFPVLPYWPDEFVEPASEGAFGKTRPGYGTTFRFDPNEAIAICGFLPPEAAYFGIQSYLFTRKGEPGGPGNPTYDAIALLGATGVFFHTLPQNNERVMLLNSLSDATNNVVIERQSGECWDQFRCFIITPDKGMENRVRQVLDKLSIADEDIFTEGIPSNMQIGLDADADDFFTGIRYSLPEDGGEKGTPSDRWRHQPTMTVLRIRDAQPNGESERYPAWEANSPEQRAAVDERGLRPDLLNLVYAVSEQWGQPCSLADCSDRAKGFIDTQSQLNMVGPLCGENGMDCLADSLDATYQFRPVQFDDNTVYAVAGTLGTATGNATYVSLGVNSVKYRLGALNVEGRELEGSATPDRYPGVNNLAKLYVYYFARDCEGLEALTDGYCTSVEASEWVIPSGGRATFVERDYIKEGTQRGPESTQTLPSMVLPLQRPEP